MSHQLADTDRTSQSIYIHSQDADVSISDSEKIFYLKNPIFCPAGYKLIVGLTNITLPNSMYNITTRNNTILFRNNATPVLSRTITVPIGNYNVDNLVSKMNELMAVDSIGTIAFNDQTSRFTFSFTTAFQIMSTSMERILGLKNQTPSGSYSTSYACLNTADLGGVINIYLRIKNLSMNNVDTRGVRNGNIIANIPNTTNYGGYIFFVPSEVLYYTVGENSISYLDIELTDQNGDVLELQGAEYNITLTVHFISERQSIFKSSMITEINTQDEEDETKELETKELEKKE